MKEITENDLIIGTKYDIPHLDCPPYVFFGSTKTLGFEKRDHLIFINCFGDIRKLSSSEIKGITQIHEPVEKSMDFWIVYNKEEAPGSFWIDKLTNLYTSGILFDSECNARECCDPEEEIKKINVTVKY
jgi:hypothetical protein